MNNKHDQKLNISYTIQYDINKKLIEEKRRRRYIRLCEPGKGRGSVDKSPAYLLNSEEIK